MLQKHYIIVACMFTSTNGANIKNVSYINMDRHKILVNFCFELYEETKYVSASSSSIMIVRHVFFVLFAKARALLNSIAILDDSGQYPSVSVLLRSLLELYIQMKWISEKDIIHLSKRYADLSNVIRMRAYLKTKKNLQKFIDSNEEDGFRERFDENNARSNLYGYKNIIDVSNWRPKKNGDKRYTISDMAKEVCLDYEYQVIYNRLCETTHIGPGSDQDFKIVNGHGLIPRKPIHAAEMISAIKYFLDIYSITNKAMGQSFKEVTFQKLRFEKILFDITSAVVDEN